VAVQPLVDGGEFGEQPPLDGVHVFGVPRVGHRLDGSAVGWSGGGVVDDGVVG